jgi:hypothetical protein
MFVQNQNQNQNIFNKYIDSHRISNQQMETQNQDPEIKIIQNWQTYLKKPKLNPQTETVTHVLRPFRRGEKRIATMTNAWTKHVSLDKNNKNNNNDNNKDTQIFLTPEYQYLFLTQISNQPQEKVDFLRRQLSKKISGYYEQDLKKGIFDSLKAITVEQVIQKCIECQLQCYYCQNQVKLLYEIVRDPLQWTLERLNNEHGHNLDNVVIACLKCNLSRRCMNSERYVKTKQMTTVLKLSDA